MTFKEYSALFLADKRSTVKPNSYKTTYDDMFRLHLLPRFGSMPLEAVNAKDVSEFMRSMAEKYSDSVLCKLRICLRGLYAAAVDEGLCASNPASNIRVKSRIEKKIKRTYSPEEADSLFEYAAAHRYGLGVCILLDTGLRCSEMLGLRWSDVDFHGSCITIRRASVTVDCKAYVSSPKSATSIRCLPITKRLCTLLSATYDNRICEYVVSRPSGTPYCPTEYIRYRYNPFMLDATAALDIPRLTTHELRHTRGTNLYASSGDIYAVSQYLGHASVDTTARFYIHSSAEILRRRLKI